MLNCINFRCRTLSSGVIFPSLHILLLHVNSFDPIRWTDNETEWTCVFQMNQHSKIIIIIIVTLDGLLSMYMYIVFYCNMLIMQFKWNNINHHPPTLNRHKDSLVESLAKQNQTKQNQFHQTKLKIRFVKMIASDNWIIRNMPNAESNIQSESELT